MGVIKNWFKDNGYEVDEYENILQAKTDTILFLVVEPHNGTNGISGSLGPPLRSITLQKRRYANERYI